MSAFDDLAEDLQDALDAAMGERIRILPRVPVQWRGQPGPDPQRPTMDIIGRYRSKPSVSELEGNREGSRFMSMTRITDADHTIRISPEQFALLGYAIKANDGVMLLEIGRAHV